MGAYYYLSDTKPPKFDYKVDVKPKPPADDASVHVHRGTAEGEEIYKDDLQKDGKGTFELDLSKLKVADSPVFVEFLFTKEDDPKSPHSTVKSVTLADAQPGKISAPKTAKLGDEIELKVTSWVAVTYLDGGATKDVAEGDKKRIASAKDEVKWQVDGADIDGTGESVKLTIADAHLGKEIVIEAYRGTVSGRAKATVAVYKLDSIDPDASVTEMTKFYVNLDADETKNQGREITIKAKVLPPKDGVTVYFKVDDSKLASTRMVTDNLKLPAADMVKIPASAKTDKEGIATVKLKLSTYGGDQYSVSACLNKDTAVGGAGTVVTRWWEVWRAVNYEVAVMQRPGDGIKAIADDVVPKVVDEYKALFLELRKTGTDGTPDFQRCVTEKEAAKFCKNIRTGTGQPRYFHLVFVNEIVWDPKVSPVDAIVFKDPPVANFSLPVTLYTIDDRDLASAFTSCTYRTDKGKRGTLKLEEKVTLTYDDDKEEWTASVDVSGIVDRTDPANINTNLLTVTLNVRSWIEGGGYATDGNATVIGCHYLESKALNTPVLSDADVKVGVLMTAMHEPAHRMGIAAKTFPEAPAKTNDTTQFKTSKGWHCNNNSKNCAMFEENLQTAGKAKREFCERCKDAIRLRSMVKLGYSGDVPF